LYKKWILRIQPGRAKDMDAVTTKVVNTTQIVGYFQVCREEAGYFFIFWSRLLNACWEMPRILAAAD
jgi:hypothetical protein